MKTALLYCKACNDLYGCSASGRKTCRSCTSHDCPLLPAPHRRKGLCPVCAGRGSQTYGALFALCTVMACTLRRIA